MLYFADHGEDAGSTDPDKFPEHNESIVTKPMFEIPFITGFLTSIKKIIRILRINWRPIWADLTKQVM